MTMPTISPSAKFTRITPRTRRLPNGISAGICTTTICAISFGSKCVGQTLPQNSGTSADTATLRHSSIACRMACVTATVRMLSSPSGSGLRAPCSSPSNARIFQPIRSSRGGQKANYPRDCFDRSSPPSPVGLRQAMPVCFSPRIVTKQR